MTGTAPPEFARGIEAPYAPDTVLGPTVVYGDRPTALSCPTDDGAYGRVTFERLDAIKVCRGEVLPFPRSRPSALPASWVYVVEPSRWLQERHGYEAQHYGGHYDWGNDVDEMLTDYDHYLFSFHDQFVEASAAGIWFEKALHSLTFEPLPPDHPLNDLPESAVIERFIVEGITCQVRANPRLPEHLLPAARYCSQPLFHFALELDGTARVSYRLDIRARRGSVRSTWRNALGRLEASFDGVATLTQARVLLMPYIREVRERRRKMGKDSR